MKIYVVSLNSSPRREFVKNIFKNREVDYKIFDAVDGRNCEHPRYNDRERILSKGHSLTPGENGCFSSHRELWQICININQLKQ